MNPGNLYHFPDTCTAEYAAGANLLVPFPGIPGSIETILTYNVHAEGHAHDFSANLYTGYLPMDYLHCA